MRQGCSSRGQGAAPTPTKRVGLWSVRAKVRCVMLLGEKLVEMVLSGPVVARMRVELLQHAVLDGERPGSDARPAREEGRVMEGTSCLPATEEHPR